MSWQDNKERGSILGMRLLIFIYKLLGTTVCQAATYPVLRYFYWTSPTLRKNLKAYYQNLRTLDPQLQARPFDNVKQFGFGIIDRLGLWTGNSQHISITRHHSDVLYQQAESGIGGVIFTAHLGNYELCRAAGKSALPSTLNVIVDHANAANINQVMKATNAQFMANIIAVEQIDIALAISLKEKIDQGEFVVIAADRVNHNSRAHSLPVTFLNQSAHFPTGPYILAKALGCPVFTLYAFRKGSGRYDAYFHRLFDRVVLSPKTRQQDLQRYMKAYVQELESYCLQYPTQWFNFYNFWEQYDKHDHPK